MVNGCCPSGYHAFFYTNPKLYLKARQILFAMKHWEKSRKQEMRKFEARDIKQEDQRKKKLKPVEKTKYRLKPDQYSLGDMEDEG